MEPSFWGSCRAGKSPKVILIATQMSVTAHTYNARTLEAGVRGECKVIPS